MIPSCAIQDKNLQPTDKFILGAILYFERLKYGYCSASNAKLAEVAGCTTGSARNAIMRLSKLNYIVCKYSDTQKKVRESIHGNVSLSSDTDWGVSSNSDTGVIKQLHRVSSNSEQRENIEKEENNNKLFDIFWDSYPVKKGKKTAMVAWKKLKPSQHNKAISDIPLRKEDKTWKAGFIPYPTTYLNQERWEDEITKDEVTPTKLAKELKAKYGGKNDRKAYQEWRKVFRDEKIKLKYQHLFDF